MKPPPSLSPPPPPNIICAAGARATGGAISDVGRVKASAAPATTEHRAVIANEIA